MSANLILTNTARISATTAESNLANNTAQVSLTIANVAPQANDDSGLSVNEDTPLAISALSNDSDPNGDTLFIGAVGTPVHGAGVISNPATIVYTPTLDFVGTDAFTYTASDGLLSDTATVTVTIRDATPPTFPTHHPATGSALITPTLGVSLSIARPVFDWTDAADNVGVVSYTLTLTGSAPFTGNLTGQAATASITTTVSSFTPTVDLPAAVYTWTVRAYDVAGNTSPYVSPPANFVISGSNNHDVYLPMIMKNN
ncbi:MAG: Ig-like domain-containing protein [Anaerolineae bacterium]